MSRALTHTPGIKRIDQIKRVSRKLKGFWLKNPELSLARMFYAASQVIPDTESPFYLTDGQFELYLDK